VRYLEPQQRDDCQEMMRCVAHLGLYMERQVWGNHDELMVDCHSKAGQLRIDETYLKRPERQLRPSSLDLGSENRVPLAQREAKLQLLQDLVEVESAYVVHPHAAYGHHSHHCAHRKQMVVEVGIEEDVHRAQSDSVEYMRVAETRHMDPAALAVEVEGAVRMLHKVEWEDVDLGRTQHVQGQRPELVLRQE
jgi:hypothetical protein